MGTGAHGVLQGNDRPPHAHTKGKARSPSPLPIGPLAGVSGLDVARAAADSGHGKPVAWLPTAAKAGAFLSHRLNSLPAGSILVNNGAVELDTPKGAGTGAISLGTNILAVNIGGNTLANAIAGTGVINVTEVSGATTVLGGPLTNFSGVINQPASPGGQAKTAFNSAAVISDAPSNRRAVNACAWNGRFHSARPFTVTLVTAPDAKVADFVEFAGFKLNVREEVAAARALEFDFRRLHPHVKVRPEVGGEGTIDRAGDVSGHGVERLDVAAIALGRARIDQQQRTLGEIGHDHPDVDGGTGGSPSVGVTMRS